MEQAPRRSIGAPVRRFAHSAQGTKASMIDPREAVGTEFATWLALFRSRRVTVDWPV